MTKRTRRQFFQTSAGALAASACGAHDPEPRQPNVLFIFSDQQHARTVSAYAGTPVQTPHIDRLAAGGCRFDSAISIYPVCSPYRGMLMSGRYPMRNGVVGNDTPLSDGMPTFGKSFRDAGYRTGYIGKWHLESTRDGFVPHARRQGFEDYWAVHSCNHDHFNSPYYLNDPDVQLTHQGYEPYSQTDLAIGFMRESVKRHSPFCLVLSFGPPHNPYKAPEENERRFQPEDDIELPANVNESEIVEELLRTDHRPKTERNLSDRKRHRERLNDDGAIRRDILCGYYAACEALDTCVGKMLDALEEFGVADDTIVVYTSDHGDMAGSHRMLSKQSPFEESCRVPCIARYPPEIATEHATNAFITPVDILPTLLSWAKVEYDPSDYDGRDVGAHAAGDATETIDSIPMMKMVHGGSPWIMNGLRPWRGIRTHRYTYAELEGSPWILFDNQEDPFQMANLIRDSKRTSLRQQLQSDMRQWMGQTGDTLTEPEIDTFRNQQVEKYPRIVEASA